MIFAVSFFVELLLLFLLSKQLTMLVSRFFFRFTKSKTATIYLMAFLFFPGTVIHELSHFFMAHLVFVSTGEIDLLPQAEKEGIKLGSVAIARTDPLRRLLIGMAPFLFGTTLLLGLLFLAIRYSWLNNTFYLVLIMYALFEIGNTMFSSRKDMEGALELIAVLTVLVIALYLIGIRLPQLNPQALFSDSLLTALFQKGSLILLAPLGIDVVVIGFLKLSP